MIEPRLDHEAKQKRKDDPMRGIHGGKRQLTGGNISLDQFQTSWLVSCFVGPVFTVVQYPFDFFLFLLPQKPTDDVPFRSQAGSQPGNPVSPAVDCNGQLLFVTGEVSSSSAGCIFDVSSDMYTTQDCSTQPPPARLPIAVRLADDFIVLFARLQYDIDGSSSSSRDKDRWDGTG